jgi:transcriptional regulator with XRE-family HTH domain
MPRPNIGRTINVEEHLARRIALERETRDWSYEELARQMTEAGCKIAGSAIFKIEKGTPRRRVTVDELVALGEVFKLPYNRLLIPLEVEYEKLANEKIKYIKALQEASRNLRGEFAELEAALHNDPALERMVDALMGDDWRARLNVDAPKSGI